MTAHSEHINIPEGSEKLRKPLVIAGPCSAESEEQLMATARGLAGIGSVDIFRCGLWKPRTRPGDFEGVGEKGLAWIQRVQEETGLDVMVEVATPEHVERCLQSGIGKMWIGSRTIVNPFSVRELSEALNGSGASIMVKNPVNPDLGLWIGALERLMSKGITKLAAIHRGFSVPATGPYRNAPLWHIPLALKQAFPELPLLCDPSHICGNRETLQEISALGLALGFDGLMIESHYRPEEALTDREQQITPVHLQSILDAVFQPKGDDTPAQLQAFRSHIDRLDDELIAILAERMQVSEKIGRLKKEWGMQVKDQSRWQELLKNRLRKATLAGLDIEFLKNILDEIHRASIKKQKETDE